MIVGFFMTLIDWTAVSVANPSIMAAFHADYESVIWVTSAWPARSIPAEGGYVLVHEAGQRAPTAGAPNSLVACL